MKMIIAIIRPFRLDDVREALIGVGIHGMTVTEVKGHGRQKGHTEIWRGAEYDVSFLPKLKIEIVVEDWRVAKVRQAIASAGKTGALGDGKIIVTPLEHIERTRSGPADLD